jgi:hypothetical protein
MGRAKAFAGGRFALHAAGQARAISAGCKSHAAASTARPSGRKALLPCSLLGGFFAGGFLSKLQCIAVDWPPRRPSPLCLCIFCLPPRKTAADFRRSLCLRRFMLWLTICSAPEPRRRASATEGCVRRCPNGCYWLSAPSAVQKALKRTECESGKLGIGRR